MVMAVSGGFNALLDAAWRVVASDADGRRCGYATKARSRPV